MWVWGRWIWRNGEVSIICTGELVSGRKAERLWGLPEEAGGCRDRSQPGTQEPPAPGAGTEKLYPCKKNVVRIPEHSAVYDLASPIQLGNDTTSNISDTVLPLLLAYWLRLSNKLLSNSIVKFVVISCSPFYYKALIYISTIVLSRSALGNTFGTAGALIFWRNFSTWAEYFRSAWGTFPPMLRGQRAMLSFLSSLFLLFY